MTMRALSKHLIGGGDSIVDASRTVGNFEHERRLVEAVQGSSLAAAWYACHGPLHSQSCQQADYDTRDLLRADGNLPTVTQLKL